MQINFFLKRHFFKSVIFKNSFIFILDHNISYARRGRISWYKYQRNLWPITNGLFVKTLYYPLQNVSKLQKYQIDLYEEKLVRH